MTRTSLLIASLATLLTPLYGHSTSTVARRAAGRVVFPISCNPRRSSASVALWHCSTRSGGSRAGGVPGGRGRRLDVRDGVLGHGAQCLGNPFVGVRRQRGKGDPLRRARQPPCVRLR